MLESGESIIKLHSITKDYGAMRALDDVTLDIGPGITGLLGPNGAGKSTLIKVLLGLVRVTQGSGTVLGQGLGNGARVIRAKVGYMPEDDCYIAGLTGVEMVRFQARLSGLPSTEALRRAHEILDFCGMEAERYREVEKYSTGMRQKLKFAQAIVHDPPLLILDEPTSGLDPEERTSMLSRVRTLVEKSGKAAILSTHILPDVQVTCDDVVILAKGRVQICERLDVLSKPTSPSVKLRVVGDPQLLSDHLTRAGLLVSVGGDGTLTVNVNSEDTEQLIWQSAQQLDVGIRALAPAKNSLEKIFLDAVREEAGTNA